MEQTYKFLKILIAVLLVCVVAAGIWAVTGKQPPREEQTYPEEIPAPEESTENPNLAPDFTVFDIDGNAVKLSDFQGKPVILNFWASWCGPCKAEMPDFEKKYKELGDKVQFLMVNITSGDDFETAKDYIAQQGYQFPVFYDTTGEAAYL